MSIDAGFPQNSNDRNRHEITASDGATIDLSAVESITGPMASGDWLRFSITDSTLLLGSLKPVSTVHVNVTGASSLLDVDGEIDLNEPGTFILSEAKLKVAGDFRHSFVDVADFDASDSIVQFNGNAEQALEVAGLDVRLVWELLPDHNFGFGQLIVGQEDQETVVRLVDNIDNNHGCKAEALYLFGLGENDPNGLYIHENSTLILDKINVYALEDGVRVDINNLFPSGVNEITYDNGGGTIRKGIAACEGDFDNDGDVDGSDLAIFAADFGRTNCLSGAPCEGDFCSDSDVDGSDLAIFAADFGRTDCP